MVENNNAWNGIFAGDEVSYQIALYGEPNSQTSISWKLITKGRTLSIGQQFIQFDNSATAVANLLLRVPSLKPQVKLPAVLVIEILDNKQSASKTSFEFKIDIYGSDLLLTERNVFQELDIRLYDPVGNTSKLFNALSIQFTQLTLGELLDGKQSGSIVLGSALALDRRRGMVDRLIELAASGGKILVFQPSAGSISMPGRFAAEGNKASAMSLADDSVVRTFANGYQWIKSDPLRLYGIELSGYRDETVVEITKNKESSWSWLHIAFGQSEGRFTVCMLPLVEHASDSPIAQIIMGRLLAFAGGRNPDFIKAEQRKMKR